MKHQQSARHGGSDYDQSNMLGREHNPHTCNVLNLVRFMKLHYARWGYEFTSFPDVTFRR